MEYLSKNFRKKKILIVNCYFDDFRISVCRKTKFPQSMTAAFLAGIFSPELCDIRLYDELYSGPLEDPKILAFPDMLVLTGLNTAFDRMLHAAAYAKTMNDKVIVVAGGPAIRAVPQYASNYFDYCCTGDIEELSQVIEDAFGMDHVSESFLEKKRAMPRFDLAYWAKTIQYVESSRNCYFRCKFCSLTAENGRYQAYELNYLRSQFETLGKKKWVHFLDNNFSSFNKEFLRERFALIKELRENEYFDKWAAEVTSDFFLQKENLDMAFDSGCLALFSGIESFDHKTLLNFGKVQNLHIPQVEMIHKCLNAGIAFLYGIVLDYSSRTIAELREELDFIIGNPEITLPSFITLAIPLLKSPFFYECADQSLFLPNIKLRDLDGATIVLKPLDRLYETVQFVKDVLEFRGLKLKVLKHMKVFHGLFKGKLSWDTMAFAQFNALLLCAPGLATAATDMGRIRQYGRTRSTRTFVGYSEPLDPVYVPAFPVNSRYQHYFRPTMLTDQRGDIAKPLIDDLFKR